MWYSRMATRCASAMLSSRRCEMITEKRKNMSRKTPAAEQEERQRSIRQAGEVAHGVEQRLARARAPAWPPRPAASSPNTPRGCARGARETSTISSRTTLRTVVTFKRRSIYPPSPERSRARRAVQPAFEFQHVDEHSQQHVHDVVQRFQGGDGGAAGGARAHLARAPPRSGSAGAAAPPAPRSPDTPAESCG